MGYLMKVRARLVGLLNGMTAHPAVWAGQAETVVILQGYIADIDAMIEDLNTLEDNLSLKRKAARDLEKSLTLVADTVSNKAIGFHTAEKEVLVEYDIKVRKPAEKRPIPSEVLIPELKDDVDGAGFVVSTKPDPNADKYEWQKGVGLNPQDLNTIPNMVHFRNTSKIIFVDDDIEPGVRYFYRVRAFNATGEGAWSAAVSRVQ